MDESNESVPPIEPDILPEPAQSRWPTVIGVISLSYALGGILCQVGAIVWGFLSEQFMGIFGMSFTMPLPMKLVLAGMGCAGTALGMMMLIGAIGTLRRRRSGVTWLKRWAILRIVLLLIGAIVAVLTAPAQIQMQRAMLEAQNEGLRNEGLPEMPEKSNDELWREAIIQSGVAAAMASIYPFFLGMYLSRRKITDEVAQWI